MSRVEDIESQVKQLDSQCAGRKHCSSQRPGTVVSVYTGSPPW